MSWSDRRIFLLGLGALAGCGFTPAYGPGGSARGLQGAILADAPNEKRAFDLVERLEERLGPSDTPRFTLSYVINTSAAGVGISPANAVTRFNLTGTVNYALRDSRDGREVTRGQVRNFTSYSATGSTIAGLSAQGDAELRLMRSLADQIVSELLASSGKWAAG